MKKILVRLIYLNLASSDDLIPKHYFYLRQKKLIKSGIHNQLLSNNIIAIDFAVEKNQTEALKKILFTFKGTQQIKHFVFTHTTIARKIRYVPANNLALDTKESLQKFLSGQIPFHYPYPEA
ncbi:MAG: hypothetical protein ACFFCI_00570 [Promethearchaeota archaeon]